MRKTENHRILAKGRMRDNDTRATGLNNNDLIIDRKSTRLNSSHL